MMKVEFYIPQTLADIKLKEMQEFQKLVEDHKDNEDAASFLHNKMIQIFCRVPLSVVNCMRKKDYEDTIEHLTKVINSTSKHVIKFDLFDTEFGFIPKLDDITAGEFADLENYLTDFNNAHKSMAVLYRPIKKTWLQKVFKSKSKDKYDIIDYNGTGDYSDVMKEMPMDVVQGAMVFFWNLKRELSISTLKYTKEELEKQKTHGSVENGVGINPLIQSLEAIITELNKFPKSDYMKYYTI
jgi:hypothetical protein